MSCEENILNVKTGSVLVLQCQYYEDDGVTPKSLAGYSIYVDFKDQRGKLWKRASTENGGIIIDTNQGNIDQGNIDQGNIGKYYIYSGDTSNWPVSKMPIDILYVYEDILQHTADIILQFNVGRSER